MEKQRPTNTDRTDDLLDLLNSRYYKKANLPPITNRLQSTGHLSETGSSFTNRIIDSRGGAKKPTLLEPIKPLNQEVSVAKKSEPQEETTTTKQDKIVLESDRKPTNLLAALSFAQSQQQQPVKPQTRTQMPPETPDELSANTSPTRMNTVVPLNRQKFDEEILIEESRAVFQQRKYDDEIEGDEENPLDDGEDSPHASKYNYDTVFTSQTKRMQERRHPGDPMSISKDHYSREDSPKEAPRGSNDSQLRDPRYLASKAPSSYGKTKTFFIRKIKGNPPVNKRAGRNFATQEVLNLVPEITPDINKREEFRPDLTDNRLVNSKHVLFKTFNRYLTNPTSFQAKPAISDLVSLNENFEDVNVVKQLFRTGCSDKDGS